MRNSRGGLGDIPSPGKAGAPPVSRRSRRAKALGGGAGPKGRPFRRRVIAVCRTLACCDLTQNRRSMTSPRVALCPYGLGQPTMFRAGWSPVGGRNGGHLEIAVSLISMSLLEVISNRSAGNGRSPGQPPIPDFQGHFRGHEGGSGRWTSRIVIPCGVDGASTIAGLADRDHAGKLKDTASLPRTATRR